MNSCKTAESLGIFGPDILIAQTNVLESNPVFPRMCWAAGAEAMEVLWEDKSIKLCMRSSIRRFRSLWWVEKGLAKHGSPGALGGWVDVGPRLGRCHERDGHIRGAQRAFVCLGTVGLLGFPSFHFMSWVMCDLEWKVSASRYDKKIWGCFYLCIINGLLVRICTEMSWNHLNYTKHFA